MRNVFKIAFTLGTAVALSGQPGAAVRPPSPAFDIAGFWTAAVHEDALERGNGPELADYGGFPINEAGRKYLKESSVI